MTRLAAWWRRRGIRRCAAGRHAWSSIADRVHCKRCQVWYPGHRTTAAGRGLDRGRDCLRPVDAGFDRCPSGDAVSTLHERLAAKVAAFTEDPPRCAGDRPWFCGADDYELAVNALRAVVELHAPERHSTFGVLCKECSVVEGNFPRFYAYPCPTTITVAEALGVQIGETP